MRIVSPLSLLLVAAAACDHVTVPSHGDAGPDSLGSLWESVDAGPTNFNAVSGSSASNVFVVGDEGTVLHWDGTALLREESGTSANLRGVTVASDNLTYAVGEQGTILRRQDGVWSADVPVTSAVLNAVWADDASAVAVGEQGIALVFAGGIWTLIANTRNDNYYAITDSDDGLYAIGSLGVVSHIDIAAASISATSLPGYTKLLAGATRWAAGAYFVGVEGGFFFWSAGQATQTQGLPQVFLRGVAVSDGDVWVVGNQGFVAKLPGGQNPTIIPTPDERWLIGVYAASAADLWIVGRSGAILRGPPGVRGVGNGGAH
jgi:photosystem II stability/assembly factor-like uncharacterized protein